MRRPLSWLCTLFLWLLLLRPVAAAPVTLAVMPFGNATGDAGLDWLSFGISQTLSYKISHLSGFEVVDALLVQNKLGGSVPDEGAALQAGQALGAEIVMVGSVQRDKKQMRLQARFLRVGGGEIGSEERSGGYTAASLFDMEDRLVFKLIKVLKMPSLSPSERVVFQLAPTRSLPAYEAATRATLALNSYLLDRNQKVQLTAAASGFQKAVKLDPYYAEAYSQLALVQLLQRQFEQAYRLAQRSVELFSGMPEGYAVLGRASFEQKKVSQAQAAASQALRFHTSALFFGLARTTLGLVFQAQKKSKDAADHYRAAIARRPSWPEPYLNLAALYKQHGQNAAAADMYELYLQAVPGAEDAAQIRQEMEQLRSDGGPGAPTPAPEETAEPGT